jgi:hypothetical protein
MSFRGATILMCLTCSGLVPCAAHAQDVGPGLVIEPLVLAPTTPESLDRDREVLWKVSLPENIRAQAADALLERWNEARAATIAMEALSGPLGTGSAGSIVLGAIARRPQPPAELFHSLADRLQRAENGERSALASALSAYRTRSSCEVLIDALRAAPDDAASRVLASALADLSGREDLGTSTDAWSAWLDTVRGTDETTWLRALADAHAARGRHARTRAENAESRLASTTRRLHLALDGAARSDLLAELLRDENPVLQDLAFELVERELAANARLSPRVGEAAVNALSSESASVRARAASLTRQMSPQGAPGAVADALVNETDARAAASLLLAAQRFALPEDVAPALRWSREPGPARAEAFATLWVLTRAGEVPHAEDRAAVLASARSVPDAERTPAVIYLLSFLGDDDDAASLRSMLWADAPELRLASGQSLVFDDRFTQDLLDAASRYSDLFRYACLSQMVHRPSIAGFRRLLDLPRPPSGDWRSPLMSVAQGLAAPELLELAEEVEDTPLRNSLLEELASPTRAMTSDPDDATLSAIARGSWLHARRLFRDGQYAQVANVLENAPGMSNVVGEDEYATLHVAALVAFGRSDLAEQSRATLDAWTAALEMVHDAPRLREGIEALQHRFGSELTAQQRQRLEALHATRAHKPVNGPQ